MTVTNRDMSIILAGLAVLLSGSSAGIVAASGNPTSGTPPSGSGTPPKTGPTKMSLNLDDPYQAGDTSDGTLVWDSSGNWFVWKGGRTILLSQYNAEASYAGQPTINDPGKPANFDYSKVGINLPTYNPPVTGMRTDEDILAGIDPWSVFPYGLGGGSSFPVEIQQAAERILTRPVAGNPNTPLAGTFPVIPYPTFGANDPI